MHYNLLTVLGPTATGKTRLATNLAEALNGEIISADSRQVYKGMDIGTGKDLEEFKDKNINYHLIDICEPTEEYNLFKFSKDFADAFEHITKKNKLPVLVGGSGLYLSSVLQNYNLPPLKNEEKELQELNKLTREELGGILFKLKPKLHNTTDLIHKERIIQAILIERLREEIKSNIIDINSLNIGIKPSRSVIKQRITKRLKVRLQSGMIEEVKELLNKGVSKERLNFFGLEYKYLNLYINGKLNYNDMYQKLNSAIHSFAKRQATWFRKMERDGVLINWFCGENYNEILNFTRSELKRKDATT
jgi:tRNA dimethylallyltransferase